MKGLTLGAILLLFPSTLWAQSALENPPDGQVVSGISIISGWKCTAGAITFTIDNSPAVELIYGASRGDTSSVCKDDGKNGFINIWNWNLVAAGQHTIRVFDNGIQFAQATFTVFTYGTEFLSGVTGAYKLGAFPQKGIDSIIQWQQSIQNFSIVGALPSVGVPQGAYGGSGTETHSLCFDNDDNGSSGDTGYLVGDGANSAYFTGQFVFPNGLSIQALFNGTRALFGNQIQGSFSFAYYKDGAFITNASGLFQGTATATEVAVSYNGLNPQFGCQIIGAFQATK